MSSQTPTEGISVDLTTNFPTTETEDAKCYWRLTKQMGLGYGKSPPDYATTVARVIAALEPESVFEFGCNAGRNLVLLRERLGQTARLAGVDINEESVRHGREELGLDLRRGDEAHLKVLADGSWDVLFTVSVLDHVPYLKSVADELVRVTRKYLCICEPVLPGHDGRIVDVDGPGDRPDVASYSYFHDYYSFFATQPVKLVYDLSLAANAVNIGPTYRLLVYTKLDISPNDFAALVSPAVSGSRPA